MYTEEEVLTILQGALDFYNEEKKSGYDYSFASEQFKHYRWFVQSLTKKKVGIKEGRVYLR